KQAQRLKAAKSKAWKAKAPSAALAAANTETKADTAESAPSPASPCVIHFAAGDCVILGYFREWPVVTDHAFANAGLIEIKPPLIPKPATPRKKEENPPPKKANAGSNLAPRHRRACLWFRASRAATRSVLAPQSLLLQRVERAGVRAVRVP